MITKKDLKEFAEFCHENHRLKIPEFVIEGYIKSFSSKNQVESHGNKKKIRQDMECDIKNFNCFHITFDSAKCNECPY